MFYMYRRLSLRSSYIESEKQWKAVVELGQSYKWVLLEFASSELYITFIADQYGSLVEPACTIMKMDQRWLPYFELFEIFVTSKYLLHPRNAGVSKLVSQLFDPSLLENREYQVRDSELYYAGTQIIRLTIEHSIMLSSLIHAVLEQSNRGYYFLAFESLLLLNLRRCGLEPGVLF
ncbi:hypothetical protein TNCT_256351 [Trichonephila clavata]|uniref:Uncharacterized protein n=1 Tax=Trichonephila clavata TaxID=2740835 RepID=A0A8X6F4F5_TRICU|nr:hypothetical protein TNCT_256351 [Trichonephila clavata]